MHDAQRGMTGPKQVARTNQKGQFLLHPFLAVLCPLLSCQLRDVQGEEDHSVIDTVASRSANGCMPSDACCCMFPQILSDGRLVKISWSDGTATKGRPCLAGFGLFPPSPSSSEGIGSGGTGTLVRDLKGFHA